MDDVSNVGSVESVDSGSSVEGAASHGAPAQSAAQQAVEYEYKWNDKTIKEPIERILQRASAGYDYAQKIADFNKRVAEVEERDKRAQALQSKWGQFDEYAQKNPEWYQHWENAWLTREAPLDDPQAQRIAQLEAQINELKGTFQTKEQQERAQKEDAQLNGEITSFRKQYEGTIDFDETDEYGISLENRILGHANQHGIKSFKVAARDYLHDRLISLHEEKAKEKIAKDAKEQRKAGVLATTASPSAQVKSRSSLKGRGYGDLAKEAIEEIRAGKEISSYQ